MGGNALGFQADRMTPEQFQEVSKDVLDLLEKNFPNVKVGIPISYSGKSSYGDVDVLLSEENIPQKIVEGELDRFYFLQQFAADHFNASFFSISKESISFDYSKINGLRFQVDFILTPKYDFEHHLSYLNYNDLSNIMGRIANSMGLSFGHLGLFYNLREGSNLIDKILLSKDFRANVKFLGFDEEKYSHGFDSLDDMFDFISDSKYFHTSLFELENLNSQARSKVNKRKTHKEFFEYVNTLERSQHTLKGEAEYLEIIKNHFPDLETQIKISMQKKLESLKKKDFLNGFLVKKLTGENGARVGLLIEKTKEKINASGFSIDEFLEKHGEAGFKKLFHEVIPTLPSEKEIIEEKNRFKEKMKLVNSLKFKK